MHAPPFPRRSPHREQHALSDKGREKHAFDGNGHNPPPVNEERSPCWNTAVHPLLQPHAPAESLQVDQLVEIVKLMGTPGPDEIRAMNHNLADFPFPQVCRPSGAVKSLHL